jgi:hypothetical protein
MPKWVKLKGSDHKIIYPHSIRIDHPCGSYHYELDTSQTRVVQCIPTILEDKGDGTYTQWSFSVWGPSGEREYELQHDYLTEDEAAREAENLADHLF